MFPEIPGPRHSDSSVAGTPAGGPGRPVPGPGTISTLEPCVGFRQRYNGPLSVLTPPPPTLLPGPSGSHWLPVGGQPAARTVKGSLGGEIQRWRGPASLPPSFWGSPPPSDIIFHPWKKEENGNQSRVILYTITLTNPLAPKTATVRETQVSRGRGRRGVAGRASAPSEGLRVDGVKRTLGACVVVPRGGDTCWAAVSTGSGPPSPPRSRGWVRGEKGGRRSSHRVSSVSSSVPTDHVQGEPGERMLRDRRRGPHARRALPRLLLHHQPLHAHPRGSEQESAQVGGRSAPWVPGGAPRARVSSLLRSP